MTYRCFGFSALLMLVFAAQARADAVTTATVIITGEGAELNAYLDGRRVGLTPARVENVPLGEHVARVEGGGRTGERSFTLDKAMRTIRVPFAGLERPLSIAAEGALGFRGPSAMLYYGAAFTYHLVNHEIGIAGDGFSVRGNEDFRIEGILARLQYAAVPWAIAGGEGVTIRPVKFQVRVNVVQTTKLVARNGGARANDVAGLGAGIGLATEVQSRGFGVEPSLYYDFFGLRAVDTSSGSTVRPRLDNGGLQLRVKYYL
jgi:hypothetical protein